MAYDSTKPPDSGSIVSADVRENFRALKSDWIISGQQVQEVWAEDATYAANTGVTAYSDDIPAITDGDQILTAAITPKASTNILTVRTLITVSSNNTSVVVHLHRDAVINALAATGGYLLTNHSNVIALVHRMVAGGTSAITFRLRAGVSSGEYYVNGRYSSPSGRVFGGVSKTSIQIIESQAS